MANTMASDYTKTYTTFSGCDIVATFGNQIIGELQAITYSVSREKAPVYTMGSAEPRSFSRGKRGIAGTMVFTVFDGDALINALRRQPELTTVNRIGTKRTDDSFNPISIDQWDQYMTDAIQGASSDEIVDKIQQVDAEVRYADEIPPFDITISFANEYGQRAVLVLYGVELLNEGTGYSIDSVTTEKACTFVARRVEPMKSLPSVNKR